eukprot:9695120-Heterocapsa_arctica.AAC.1
MLHIGGSCIVKVPCVEEADDVEEAEEEEDESEGPTPVFPRILSLDLVALGVCARKKVLAVCHEWRVVHAVHLGFRSPLPRSAGGRCRRLVHMGGSGMRKLVDDEEDAARAEAGG